MNSLNKLLYRELCSVGVKNVLCQNQNVSCAGRPPTQDSHGYTGTDVIITCLVIAHSAGYLCLTGRWWEGWLAVVSTLQSGPPNISIGDNFPAFKLCPALRLKAAAAGPAIYQRWRLWCGQCQPGPATIFCKRHSAAQCSNTRLAGQRSGRTQASPQTGDRTNIKYLTQLIIFLSLNAWWKASLSQYVLFLASITCLHNTWGPVVTTDGCEEVPAVGLAPR